MVRGHGVALSPEGADLVGLCPFHAETTPSFRVTPSKNLWHCFGCGKGGSAVDWIVATRGVSLREAFRFLSVSHGVPTGPVRSLVEPDEPCFEADPAWDDDRLLGAVADYYASRLRVEPAAQEYLSKRGLWDGALVDRFRLGFSDRTLGPALDRHAQGSALRGRLSGLGVFRSNGREHLRGSLVVPVLGNTDGMGVVPALGLYGRKIRNDLRAGTPLHLYLKGEHRGVFNAAGVLASRSDTVILCEALLDALTFVRWGFEHATSAYGVHGVTPDLWRFLTESGFRRVLIAFDADEAGDRAAMELAPRLAREGLEVQRIGFPQGQDANQYALSATAPAEALRMVCEGARWLSESLYPSSSLPETDVTGIDSNPGNTASEADLPGAAQPEHSSLAVAPQAVPAVAAEAAEPSRVPEVEVDSGTYETAFGDRSWRVKGLFRNRSDDVLRVTVRVSRQIPGYTGFHLDTLDLYQAKSRETFSRAASPELGVSADVLRADLARLIVALEERQTAQLAALRTPSVVAERPLAPAERDAALALLRRPDMLRQLLCDLEASGMVGEEENKLLCWLSLTSRHLDTPLGVLIQSSSAAGKSSLLDGVLRTMPEEAVVRYSAMSGQALFYMGGVSLKHKILCVAEEEGARRASYSLKLLQSDGELTMASTGKDPESGQLVTKEYKTEGPVALAMTTTSIDVDPELQNRCLVLSVDESREQTQAIHQVQRSGRTRDGQARRQDAAHRLAVWRNAQRMLEPISVVNPYAESLTFASHSTRTRRDMAKYLTLVEAVALAHQHQKPRRFDSRGSYIEVDLDDIELANLLAAQALGRNLAELPLQTSELLRQLGVLVLAESQTQGVGVDLVGFSRRWVRERTHWGDTQLKVHLRRLEELEYLTMRKGGQGAFEYRFSGLSVGLDGSVLAGLLDVATLRSRCPEAPYRGTWMHGAWNRTASMAAVAGESVGPVGGWAEEVRPIGNRSLDASQALSDAGLRSATDSPKGAKRESVGVGGATHIGTESVSGRSRSIVLPGEVATASTSSTAPPVAVLHGANGRKQRVPELVL